MGVREDIETINAAHEGVQEELEPLIRAHHLDKEMSDDEYDEAAGPLKKRINELVARRRELHGLSPHGLGDDDLAALAKDVSDLRSDRVTGLRHIDRSHRDRIWPLPTSGSYEVTRRLQEEVDWLGDRLRWLERERARRALVGGYFDDYAAPIKADVAEAKAELWTLVERYRVDLSKADYIAAAEPLKGRIREGFEKLYAVGAEAASDLSDDDLAALVAEMREFHDDVSDRLSAALSRRDRAPEATLDQLKKSISQLLLKLQFEESTRETVTEGAVERLKRAVADGVLDEETLERLRPYFYNRTR